MSDNMPKLEARIRLHNDQAGRRKKLLAYAELTISDAFVIKGIKVLQTRDEERNIDGEPFVTFPAERGKSTDRWYDLAHPCTAEARRAAVQAILAAYFKAIEVLA